MEFTFIYYIFDRPFDPRCLARGTDSILHRKRKKQISSLLRKPKVMSAKSPITCHGWDICNRDSLLSDRSTTVLDSSCGKPASGVRVAVHKKNGEGDMFIELAVAETNGDGRCSTLFQDHEIDAGVYRITFYVEEYFQREGKDCFYPQVQVGARSSIFPRYTLRLYR